MALIEMNFASGGGGITETTLWENSTPTSSFAGQTVTLSDNMDNYDFLKFCFNRSTTNTTDKCEIIYSVDEFKKFTAAANHFNGATAFYPTDGTARLYARAYKYISNTQVAFENMYQMSGTVSDNGAGIPTKIIGMKM